MSEKQVKRQKQNQPAAAGCLHLSLLPNQLDDIRNTQKIAAVVVNGRYLSRADLDRILCQVEMAASSK